MDIQIENKPLTEADIEEKEALIAYEKERDEAIAQAEADKAAAQAKLAALGLTVNDLKALGL